MNGTGVQQHGSVPITDHVVSPWTTISEGREPGKSQTGQSCMTIQNLEREMATYEKELPSLLAEQGKFVLIFGDEVLGTFEAYADAIQAGYKKAGLQPFLVKRISGPEQIAYFTRDLQPACQA